MRKQLDVTLGDIVGNSYEKTHMIGEYALNSGYEGIIAPSVRADGGLNVILFDGNSIK